MAILKIAPRTGLNFMRPTVCSFLLQTASVTHRISVKPFINSFLYPDVYRRSCLLCKALVRFHIVERQKNRLSGPGNIIAKQIQITKIWSGTIQGFEGLHYSATVKFLCIPILRKFEREQASLHSKTLTRIVMKDETIQDLHMKAITHQ